MATYNINVLCDNKAVNKAEFDIQTTVCEYRERSSVGLRPFQGHNWKHLQDKIQSLQSLQQLQFTLLVLLQWFYFFVLDIDVVMESDLKIKPVFFLNHIPFLSDLYLQKIWTIHQQYFYNTLLQHKLIKRLLSYHQIKAGFIKLMSTMGDYSSHRFLFSLILLLILSRSIIRYSLCQKFTKHESDIEDKHLLLRMLSFIQLKAK